MTNTRKRVALLLFTIVIVSLLGWDRICADDASVCEYLREQEIDQMIVEWHPRWFVDLLSYDIPQYDIEARDFVWYSWWNATEEKAKRMNLAYQLWGKDFVLTLQQENGYRNPKYQSECYWPKCLWPASWYPRERSYGFCQLNIDSWWYGRFVYWDYFNDPVLQMIFCRNEYQKAVDWGYISTKFYWYRIRNSHLRKFTFPREQWF